MLKPIPLANTLTIITVAFYLVCWVIFNISQDLYNLLINSYSLGADVASLFRPAHTLESLIVAAVVSGATAWVTGYAIAWLYNRMAK